MLDRNTLNHLPVSKKKMNSFLSINVINKICLQMMYNVYV